MIVQKLLPYLLFVASLFCGCIQYDYQDKFAASEPEGKADTKSIIKPPARLSPSTALINANGRNLMPKDSLQMEMKPVFNKAGTKAGELVQVVLIPPIPITARDYFANMILGAGIDLFTTIDSFTIGNNTWHHGVMNPALGGNADSNKFDVHYYVRNQNKKLIINIFYSQADSVEPELFLIEN